MSERAHRKRVGSGVVVVVVARGIKLGQIRNWRCSDRPSRAASPSSPAIPVHSELELPVAVQSCPFDFHQHRHIAGQHGSRKRYFCLQTPVECTKAVTATPIPGLAASFRPRSCLPTSQPPARSLLFISSPMAPILRGSLVRAAAAVLLVVGGVGAQGISSNATCSPSFDWVRSFICCFLNFTHIS